MVKVYQKVLCFTKSRPNKVQVCCMILASHFSFGSGGGVPAMGCGRGRVAVPVLFAFFADGRETVHNREEIIVKL